MSVWKKCFRSHVTATLWSYCPMSVWNSYLFSHVTATLWSYCPMSVWKKCLRSHLTATLGRYCPMSVWNSCLLLHVCDVAGCVSAGLWQLRFVVKSPESPARWSSHSLSNIWKHWPLPCYWNGCSANGKEKRGKISVVFVSSRKPAYILFLNHELAISKSSVPFWLLLYHLQNVGHIIPAQPADRGNMLPAKTFEMR